jgi:sporulation related protein
MAEDHNRPHRSSESIARTGQARGSSSGSDPLAELARLIGQSDPFGDAMNAPARMAESAGAPPKVDWTAPSTQPHHEQSFAPGQYSSAPAEQDHAPAQNYAQPAYDYTQQSYQPHAYAQPHDAELYQVQHEVPSYPTARGPTAEPPAYHAGEDQFAAEQHEIYDDVPPRRRIGVLAIAAIFGLAVIGTVGAFGYRSLFGGSGTRVPPVIAADKSPLKVVPNNAGNDGKKAIADRVTNEPLEKVLPREEKPVDIAQKIAETTPPIEASAPMASAGNGVIAGEPKKVHTIAIRPDGTEAPQMAMASPMPPMPASPQPAPAPKAQPAPTTTSATPARPAPAPKPAAEASVPRAQASANAPLSLNPNAAEPTAASVRTANAAPTALAPEPAPARAAAAPHGHTVAYAVQVSSQKSEAEAKAAYKGLLAKYASQLSGKPMFVYSVNLGAKGVYYRTMIGPYAEAAEATEICSSLKSAGGSCIVQRN